MFRKALTHLIIIALAVLPVQVISASVEKADMHMSMNHSTQVDNECVHASNHKMTGMEAGQIMSDKECCDDQSHQCQSCNNCPQAAASAMLLLLHSSTKISSSKTQKYFTSYLFLNGVPQKNLLRPPRTLI
ncbi:MAG: hypothetical protein OQK75_03435 [Gammaproteobacteria bacterium]|nr:hypothetical protein [Gammaproteobacteria bacterium]MCW8986701.1 hypothetical protein [Gammaproteobacteria bacterium]